MSFDIPSIDLRESSSVGRVEIYNNQDNGVDPSVDTISFGTSAWGTEISTPAGDFSLSSVQVGFTDTDAVIFSDTSLPTAIPPFGRFESASVLFVFLDNPLCPDRIDCRVSATVNRLTELSLSSILSNSVEAKVCDDNEMRIRFRPNFELTLDEAAGVAGVDHFNWISWVNRADILDDYADDPAIDRFRDKDGNLPHVPYFDPVPGGFRYQANEAIGRTLPVKDQLPWYLDEEFSAIVEQIGGDRIRDENGNRIVPDSSPEQTELEELSQNQSAERTIQCSQKVVPESSNPEGADGQDETLEFVDIVSSSGVIEFETCLVGVHHENRASGTSWHHPSTCIFWRYEPRLFRDDITIDDDVFSNITPVDVPKGTIRKVEIIQPGQLSESAQAEANVLGLDINLARDLAITKISAPKKVALSDRKPAQQKIVAVQIQNRSPENETIPDLQTLDALIKLQLLPIGQSNCDIPTPVLVKSSRKLPTILKPKEQINRKVPGHIRLCE